MMKIYLDLMLKEYKTNEPFSLSNLEECDNYMWIKEQQDKKISRPESFKMPKVDNDEDFLSGMTKKLKTKLKGESGALGEVGKIQKKAENTVGKFLDKMVSKVQGSFDESLGSLVK